MEGKVITSRGPVEPEELGAVLMHEHLHCDMYDWLREELIAPEELEKADLILLILKNRKLNILNCRLDLFCV